MAARTKGFFEQDPRSKPRPGQWRSNTHRTPLAETTANAPPARPPIPPTEQAKSKLKAFEFVRPASEQSEHHEATPKQASDQAEETAPADGQPIGVVTIPEAATSFPESQRQVANEATHTLQLPHANTFPSTPGARLTLEDLIGTCDEVRKPDAADESPGEQVGWIPNSSSNLLTPGHKRKRKRAKSSSPTCPANSSQQNADVSASLAGQPSQIDKRTPQANPATDLWQQYATGKQSVESLKLPDLSHLINASPKGLLETPMKGGGLRRWASAGNDWPSTKNKRQRTGVRSHISVWQEGTAESSGKSKVAAMVQKIQESLATQKLEHKHPRSVKVRMDAPSSSSPLPETGAESSGIAAAVSPLQSKQPDRPQQQTRLEPPPPFQAQPQMQPLNQLPPRMELTLSNLPQASGQEPKPRTNYRQHMPPLTKVPLPAFKKPSITRPPSQPKAPAASATVPPLPAAVRQDLDEFGDDAFDLTADDLDELITAPLDKRSLYDIPPHPDPPPPQQTLQHAGPSRAAPTQVETITIDDDDEFGCDDIDEDTFVQAEFTATQTRRISPRKRNFRSPRKHHGSQPATSISTTSGDGAYTLHHRYIVKQVVDGEYVDAKGRSSSEKLLLAEDERTRKTTAITLRDSWADTSISKNTIIHIAFLRRNSRESPISRPLGQITITHDEDSPFLIIHPDHMLSATTVADSFDCVRKAVLQDRIKATGESSKAMVYGQILHEIFQQALSANEWNSQFLAELVERTVRAHVEGLWELGMRDTNLAAEEVKAKMGELAAWAEIFVAAEPGAKALVDDKQGEKVRMSVSKLIAIEEHIWSPRFGLKGNVDATVQSSLVTKPGEAAKKLVVPFEVKTGRTTHSPAHRAQTALYTILLSDRYDVNVEAGILYYLESSSMSRVAPSTNEVRQMVQQRNRLAAYIHRARFPSSSEPGELGAESGVKQTQEIEESGLPALLKSPFKCGKCYAQQSCFTYHALAEQGTAQTAGMVDDGKKDHSLVWSEAVGHMLLSSAKKDNQAQALALKMWFSKWDRLLTFEESEQSRFRKELWKMPSYEREALGRCFGDLVLVKDLTAVDSSIRATVVDGIAGSGGKINRFAYSFARVHASPSRSFTEGGQLTVGEPVVVSSESGQWALANGYVVAVGKQEITVAVDRKLGAARERLTGFDKDGNQAFRGTMTVGKGGHPISILTDRPTLYRLDKDEFSNGLALIRNNLVTLMSSHPIHTKLREQIIFDAPPTFITSSAPSAMQSTLLGSMNEDQQAAVSKVLSAQDYALILGMPGTGKTTTIAHIIRALLAEDKSILLTSFTHTAVDNILLKIREIVPAGSVLRLGVPAKINNQVQTFCQLAATPKKTIDEVEAAYMGTQIVATTCMGTNHALFQQRSFDVCIVDEASQITLPTILGPLLKARKFVLVGDHFQLPPLVQNKRALEGGLDVSLFRQLSERRPEAVVALGRQYRMCEEIMSLSNTLIYDGKLRCGSEEVARRTLKTVTLEELHRFHAEATACPFDTECWLRRSADPRNKVVFSNTDTLGRTALETLTSGRNITNELEATLCAQLVLTLLALGVPGSEIGVITLYRSQLSLIKQLFRNAGISGDVEIDSADRFQGRDKECIILSMVRSNEAGIVGDLLKDWRRVNVALTRARSKLIVLGSRRTLVNNELLAKFLSLVEEKRWTLDLPSRADEMHSFDFSTQLTGSLGAGTGPEMNSPIKASQTKAPPSTPSRVLQLSQSAGNRSPSKGCAAMKAAGVKKSPKVIKGRSSQATGKTKRAKEQLVFEIFEDFTADDI